MTYALDHPHKSLENTPPLKWVRNMHVHGAKLLRNTCNLHARAFASGASESKRQIAQSMFGLSLIPENYRIPERLQALRRFEAARFGWIRKFPNDNVHGMCLDGGWCRWIRNCSFCAGFVLRRLVGEEWPDVNSALWWWWWWWWLWTKWWWRWSWWWLRLFRWLLWLIPGENIKGWNSLKVYVDDCDDIDYMIIIPFLYNFGLISPGTNVLSKYL